VVSTGCLPLLKQGIGHREEKNIYESVTENFRNESITK
jgi:hypothetical protein